MTWARADPTNRPAWRWRRHAILPDLSSPYSYCRYWGPSIARCRNGQKSCRNRVRGLFLYLRILALQWVWVLYVWFGVRTAPAARYAR